MNRIGALFGHVGRLQNDDPELCLHLPVTDEGRSVSGKAYWSRQLATLVSGSSLLVSASVGKTQRDGRRAVR